MLPGIVNWAGGMLGAVASRAADQLAHNPFATLLAPGDAAAAPTATSHDAADAAPDRLSSLLRELHEQVAQRLLANGVPLDGPLLLRPDRFGGVTVEGDPVLAVEVERAIHDDPQLLSLWREIAWRAEESLGSSSDRALDAPRGWAVHWGEEARLVEL